MSGQTLWQEVIADGMATFGGGNETPPKTQEDASDVVDSFGMDKQAQQWYKELHPPNQTSTDIDEGGDVPVEQDTSDMSPEDLISYSIFMPSIVEARKAATQKVREQYGEEFLHLDPESRRKAVEYETDEVIATQFGGEPKRSVIGTVGHNINRGFNKSFFQNLDTLSKAMWGGVGIGGEEDRLNPSTGRVEPFVHYDDLIPGFSSMDFDSRRQALTDLKNTDLYKQKVEMNASEEGFLSGASFLAGAIADPTSMIPLGAGYKTAAVLSGLVAGSDMFIYDLAETGTIEPKRIGTATAIGAVAGPVMLLGGKKVGKVLSQRHRNKLINKFEKDYTIALAKGESKSVAEIYARVNNGNMTQGALDKLYQTTGRTRKLPDTPKTARLDLEERLSFFHRYEILAKTGRKIEDIVTPISDRIYRQVPKVAQELRRNDLNTHLMQHNWFLEVAPFLRQYRKFTETDRKLIKKLISANDAGRWNGAYDILKIYEKEGGKFKGLVDNFDNLRSTLKEVEVMYKQTGYELDHIEHFFPRVATDPKALSKVPNTFLAHSLKAAAKKKGRPLTDYEIGKEINNILNFKAKPGQKVKTSGSLREREIDTLSEAMLPHYADPEGALHSYLRMASMDINRARFMKQFGYKGKFRTDGTGTESLIGETLTKEFKRVGLGAEDQDMVVKLLQSRFTTGEMSPNNFWKGFKNIGYAYTIGNPISALTQLGDQAFAMYKANIKNAVYAAARATVIPERISGIPLMRKEDFGLSEAMEEIFANPSATKKFLDITLEWGGFNAMDRFGKETIINGVLHKYMKEVRTEKGLRKFIAKWGPYFEGETSSLVRDVQKYNTTYIKKMKTGKKKGQLVETYAGMTDNMKLMLWHELADVQPIALSEMPKWYLDHPNGRVLYMLKTFTIKQVDFMRREIFRKYREGHPIQATKNLAMFASFWMLMNGGADKLKTLLTGEEFDVTDNMLDNMMQLMVFGRYSKDQAMKEGLWAAITEYITPPAPYADTAGQILFGTKEPTAAIELVPIVGKVISKNIKSREKQREKLRRGMTLEP